jgi:zinc transport system ATP-binding protein
MKSLALSIEDLCFHYDAAAVLEQVNLSIEEGEFVGIFGPNGGGKTTLLKLILGLLRPQQGSVRLFGLPPEEARQFIGYVPQTIRFDRDFPIDVEGVVKMGALNKMNWLGRYPTQVKDQVLAALDKVKLSHKAKAPFGTLSGGEMQRALIARAMLDAPRMLILDEPTANIDPEGQKSIHELLSELNQSMTILMVTHDLQTIIDKVGTLLCVQRSVTRLKAKEVCEHFALGLYHAPLTSGPHFHNFKGR